MDNYNLLDNYREIPADKVPLLSVTIGNYALIKFEPINDDMFYSQFVKLTISPLPNNPVQFEPLVKVALFAESINGNISNPKDLIPTILDIREELIELNFIPSISINAFYEQNS